MGDVSIFRIDDHRPDLPALLPALFPGFPGICGLVDAVAGSDVAARVRLPRADIDYMGVGGRNGDGPNGVRRLIVKDRLPRQSAIARLPDPARRRGEIVGERVA